MPALKNLSLKSVQLSCRRVSGLPSAQAEALPTVSPLDLHWHPLAQLLEHCWDSHSSSAQLSMIQGCGAGALLLRGKWKLTLYLNESSSFWIWIRGTSVGLCMLLSKEGSYESVKIICSFEWYSAMPLDRCTFFFSKFKYLYFQYLEDFFFTVSKNIFRFYFQIKYF